mgnify:CR=1 FL=1
MLVGWVVFRYDQTSFSSEAGVSESVCEACFGIEEPSGGATRAGRALAAAASARNAGRLIEVKALASFVRFSTWRMPP